MGFRTVVVLNNDWAHDWENDTKLGKKIMEAAARKHRGNAPGNPFEARAIFPYGDIVEQVHADTQTLAVLDGYSGEAITHSNWHKNQTSANRDLALLKAMADKLGYRISKKPTSR